MKRLTLAASSLLLVVALSACGSSVANFEIQDEHTGTVLDRLAVVSSAEHPLTPGVTIAGRVDGHGQFDVIGMAAAGSPVEQISPMVSAAIGAAGNIAAAREMPGTNVVATGGGGGTAVAEGGDGGNAFAEGGNAIALGGNASAQAVNWNSVRTQVTATQWTNLTTCRTSLSYGGGYYRYPTC